MGSAVLVVAAGWSVGIALGAALTIPLLPLVVCVAVALVALWLARAVGLRLAALALIACLLGQLRVSAAFVAPAGDMLHTYAGDVAITGRIVEAPIQRGARVEAVVEVERVGRPGESEPLTTITAPGPRVMLRAVYLRAGHGDRIETRGRLARPRSRPGWPLEEMLARRQIGWILDAGGARVVESGGGVVRALGDVRAVFEANTRAVLPEPHASLVAGMVFGARVGLPAELRAALSATGTSHLTAASGANVALVSGACILLLGALLGRVPASILAILGVWAYTVLVGSPPSAMRAATMATFALAAQGLGRQSDAFGGLVLGVALLLAWEPGLAFDIGFQLSAAATAGLILLSPAIEGWFGWLPRAARGQVAIAIAAQIATLPLVIGTFQRLSLVALPANLLAAPTIVPIMALGTAIAFLGTVPVLGDLLGWAAWAVSSVLLGVIQAAASVPGAVVGVGRAPVWLPLGWYAVLGCWAAAGSADVKALGVSPVALQRTAAIGAGVLMVLTFTGLPGVGRSEGVQVALFDAEPAAALVRTPGGTTVLLVTSTASRGIVPSVGAHLDLAEAGIDVEIGPHGVRTGVALLDAGMPYTSAADVRADDGDEWLSESAPAVALEPGALVDVGEGVTVQVVASRLVGQQTVVDLAMLVEGVTVLLPGPAAAGATWDGVAPDATTVAVLPANTVTWARGMAPRSWLVVIGEAPAWPGAEPLTVPYLSRREFGAVELLLREGGVTVRTERCAGGRGCVVDLPPPSRATLTGAPTNDTPDDDHAPVQSDRNGGGR